MSLSAHRTVTYLAYFLDGKTILKSSNVFEHGSKYSDDFLNKPNIQDTKMNLLVGVVELLLKTAVEVMALNFNFHYQEILLRNLDHWMTLREVYGTVYILQNSICNKNKNVVKNLAKSLSLLQHFTGVLLKLSFNKTRIILLTCYVQSVVTRMVFNSVKQRKRIRMIGRTSGRAFRKQFNQSSNQRFEDN